MKKTCTQNYQTLNSGSTALVKRSTAFINSKIQSVEFSEQIGSIRILHNQNSFNTLARGHSQWSASRINHLRVSTPEEMSLSVNTLVNINESFCLDMLCRLTSIHASSLIASCYQSRIITKFTLDSNAKN